MPWLQEFLDEASAANLCVRPGCTTCGASDFDQRLMRASRGASRFDFTARGWTPRTLIFVAEGLSELRSVPERDVAAVRYIIFRLYGMLGEDEFNRGIAPKLQDTAAGGVLEAMRSHHAIEQERRRRTRLRK